MPGSASDQLVLQSPENVQLKRNVQLTKPVCAEKERDDGVETSATENDYTKTSDTPDGNAQLTSANATQQVSTSSEENEPRQSDEGRSSSQHITPSQSQSSTSSDRPKRNIVPHARFKSFVTSFR